MEDIAKTFHRTSISLARLLFGVKDPYFMRKVFEKSENLARSFINFEKGVGESFVANRDSLLSVINEIADLCDYVEHLKLSPISPLLVLRKNILLLKLQVLKQGKKNGDTAIAPEKKKAEPRKSATISDPILTREKDKKIEGNRQKILDFVRRFPNTRTKEVIDEFNVLSVRTVKRSLKGLVDDGLLQKRIEANAVFYFPSNIN